MAKRIKAEKRRLSGREKTKRGRVMEGQIKECWGGCKVMEIRTEREQQTEQQRMDGAGGGDILVIKVTHFNASSETVEL